MTVLEDVTTVKFAIFCSKNIHTINTALKYLMNKKYVIVKKERSCEMYLSNYPEKTDINYPIYEEYNILEIFDHNGNLGKIKKEIMSLISAESEESYFIDPYNPGWWGYFLDKGPGIDSLVIRGTKLLCLLNAHSREKSIFEKDAAGYDVFSMRLDNFSVKSSWKIEKLPKFLIRSGTLEEVGKRNILNLCLNNDDDSVKKLVEDNKQVSIVMAL